MFVDLTNPDKSESNLSFTLALLSWIMLFSFLLFSILALPFYYCEHCGNHTGNYYEMSHLIMTGVPVLLAVGAIFISTWKNQKRKYWTRVIAGLFLFFTIIIESNYVKTETAYRNEIASFKDHSLEPRESQTPVEFWKIFENTKHGFSFKYPPEGMLESRFKFFDQGKDDRIGFFSKAGFLDVDVNEPPAAEYSKSKGEKKSQERLADIKLDLKSFSEKVRGSQFSSENFVNKPSDTGALTSLEVDGRKAFAFTQKGNTVDCHGLRIVIDSAIFFVITENIQAEKICILYTTDSTTIPKIFATFKFLNNIGL